MTAIRLQRWLLICLVISVPPAFWTGTLLNIDVKYFLVRIGTVLLVVAKLMEAIGSRKLEIPFFPVALAGFAFCVFAWGTGICHPYSDGSTTADIVLALVFFLCVTSLTRDLAYVRLLLTAWIGSAVIVCGYYFIHKFGFDPIHWFNPKHNVFGSTFGNRNYLAYFLICSLPFAFYLPLNVGIRRKILLYSCAAVILATLVMSNSRSSWGILLVSLPAILWYSIRRSGSRPEKNKMSMFLGVPLFGLAVGIAAVVWLVLYLPNEKLNALTHGRWGIWKDTFGMISASPWVGHGPGSFPRLFPAFRSTDLGYLFGFYAPVHNSHSVYLEILSETGIIGLVLFSVFLLTASGLVSRTPVKSQNHRDLAFFSGLSLMNCGIFSLTGEVSNVLFCAFFSWLALALFFNAISGKFQTIAMSVPWKPLALFAVGSMLAASAIWWFGTRFAANIQVRIATNLIGRNAGSWLPGRHLKKALELEPGNPFALYQLAFLSMKERNYNQALDYYREIETRNPYFENLQFNRGVAYYSLDRPRQAIDEFLITARIYPTFANAPLFLSKAYLAEGKLDSAGIWCDQLITLGAFQQAAVEMRASIAKRRLEARAPNLN